MSSILRVCLSSEYPVDSEVLSNYYYFLYDRLILYKGSEKITSNYCISEVMPESPVSNMLYILHDGTIRQYKDYSVITIATIEDPSQIDYIVKAGSTYFINGDSRYIDKHDRTLVMPFNSETYELVVNYKDEDTFRNDTIVKYNEDTGQFELYSGQEKFYEYSKEITGKETRSVKTNVTDGRLTAEVKISNAFGNALKAISDGLFVRGDNKVNKEDFDEFYKDFRDLKSYCYAILDNVEAQIEYLKGIITKEAIDEEIHNQLVGQYSGIDQALAEYEEIRNKLDSIESTAMSYASNTINTAVTEIDSGLQEASEWDDLSDDVSNYTHEVNYYERSQQYENDIPTRKKKIFITAAIAAFFTDFGSSIPIDDNTEVIITPVDPDEPQENTLTQEQLELILAAAISAYIKST